MFIGFGGSGFCCYFEIASRLRIFNAIGGKEKLRVVNGIAVEERVAIWGADCVLLSFLAYGAAVSALGAGIGDD